MSTKCKTFIYKKLQQVECHCLNLYTNKLLKKKHGQNNSEKQNCTKINKKYGLKRTELELS